MNTQPEERSSVEALRLADELEYDWNVQDASSAMWQAAAELRRLHALNAELLKKMRYIAAISNGQVSRVARLAIARAEGTCKAEGEQA